MTTHHKNIKNPEIDPGVTAMLIQGQYFWHFTVFVLK